MRLRVSLRIRCIQTGEERNHRESVALHELANGVRLICEGDVDDEEGLAKRLSFLVWALAFGLGLSAFDL